MRHTRSAPTPAVQLCSCAHACVCVSTCRRACVRAPPPSWKQRRRLCWRVDNVAVACRRCHLASVQDGCERRRTAVLPCQPSDHRRPRPRARWHVRLRRRDERLKIEMKFKMCIETQGGKKATPRPLQENTPLVSSLSLCEVAVTSPMHYFSFTYEAFFFS